MKIITGISNWFARKADANNAKRLALLQAEKDKEAAEIKAADDEMNDSINRVKPSLEAQGFTLPTRGTFTSINNRRSYAEMIVVHDKHGVFELTIQRNGAHKLEAVK